MDLSDALGEWPSGGNNQPGGAWPNNSTWPGQPGANPTWPGGQPGGQPGANPTWPGGQPGANPTWPGGQPGANPTWPGGQPGGQPGANPTWPGGQPGGQPGANPTWPGGQPGVNPTWPGGQPTNPTWPSGPSGGGGTWPGGPPSQPIVPGGFGPGPAVPTAPQKNLTVPYHLNLPQGVTDKLLITICGTIKPNADKITLDFCTSNDVAFHFNPRFNEAGKKVIVRNSCLNKNWGKEERDLKNFPFVQGQPFEMKILCINNAFKVAVNNSHLLEFKHRTTNLRSIDKVNIYNDLTLSDVRIETTP